MVQHSDIPLDRSANSLVATMSERWCKRGCPNVNLVDILKLGTSKSPAQKLWSMSTGHRWILGPHHRSIHSALHISGLFHAHTFYRFYSLVECQNLVGKLRCAATNVLRTTFCGTMDYLAPEMIQVQYVSAKNVPVKLESVKMKPPTASLAMPAVHDSGKWS